MRLFIGIPLSNETRKLLHDLQLKILQNAQTANPTDIQNMHLTLAFLGETEVSKLDDLQNVMQNVLSNYSSFNIDIIKTSAFSKGNEYLVYGEIDSGKPLLMELANSIRKELKDAGISFEEGPFTPHITLARRVRYVSSTPSYKINQINIIETIQQICLYESTRVDGLLTYIPLITIPLNESR